MDAAPKSAAPGKATVAARRLRLMAFDVDGVLTDGRLYYSDEGIESKAFHVRDGSGLKMLREAGITLAVITGRRARCVEHRMRDLGIEHLHQGVENKRSCMEALLRELGLKPEEAGFMGDDLIDLPVMRLCGFSAAPADAAPLARQQALMVTPHEGGRGAVRDVCEFILEAQGRLSAALSPWIANNPPGASREHPDAKTGQRG